MVSTRVIYTQYLHLTKNKCDESSSKQRFEELVIFYERLLSLIYDKVPRDFRSTTLTKSQC